MSKTGKALHRLLRQDEGALIHALFSPSADQRKAAFILARMLSECRHDLDQARENGIMASEASEAFEDSYPGHPGRKGGGSLPRGTAPAEIRARARRNPHVRNGLDGDDSVHAVSGFKKDKRESHAGKHGGSLGLKTTRAYEQAGIEFMSAPLSETGEEIVMRDGRRCRVDHALGVVGIVNSDGSLRTFYAPKQYHKTTIDTMEDWMEEDEKNG